MDLKLVVMDMDGTLLTSNKVISQKTKETLIALQHQGVKVGLASGRSANRLDKYAEELDMINNGGLLLEANGVAVLDYGDNSHHVIARISKEEANELVDFLKPLDKEIIVMGAVNAFIIPKNGETESLWVKNMNEESKYGRVFNIVSSVEEVDEDINKICVYDEDTVAINELNTKLAVFDDDYWHGLVHDTWLEITPHRISKGNALKYVMEKYNFSLDQVVCFGDSDNDASMFKVCKYGIAMGNALDRIKAISFDVCEDNDHDGIANYLEKLTK